MQKISRAIVSIAVLFSMLFVLIPPANSQDTLIISSISTPSITSTSATISFKTNIPAKCCIEYGQTVSYGKATAYSSKFYTSHAFKISGLSYYTAYHFRIITRDKNGSVTTSADFTFTTKDPYPPTGTVKINNNAPYTNSPDVTLSLSATDRGGSGLDKMQFSNDKKTWSGLIDYAATATWQLKSGLSGPRYVYAKFTDKAGNTSSVVYDTITLDTTKPTGTIKINNNAASTRTKDVILTLRATDTYSGINTTYGQMCFSNDNITYSEPEAYRTSKNWQLSEGSGTKTVYVKFRDRAGNWSNAISDSIEYISPDNIPPTGTISINNNAEYTSSANVTLNLSAQDNAGGSGVSQMMISQDANFAGASWQNYTSSLNFILPSGDGTKTIYAKFKDAAGNESQAVSDTIILDITPPLITLMQPPTPTNKDVTLSYTVSDNLTPKDQIIVTGDNSPYTEEGQHQVTLEATDLAGHTASSNTVTFTIDKTPPILRWTGENGFSDDGLNPNTGYGTTNFEFRIKCFDNKNQAPSVHKVYIDKNGDEDFTDLGEANDMTPGEGDYINGVIYSYSSNIPYSETGSGIKYYFEFTDGLNQTQGEIHAGYSPATAIAGPIVSQTLSISVSPNRWDMGEIGVGTIITMTETDKITVTNNGDGKENFALSLINPQEWVCGSQSDTETFVLNAAFSQNPLNIIWNENNHQVSTETLVSTQSRFAGDEIGKDVPQGERRNLFLQFKSPTKTQAIDTKSIALIISCEAQTTNERR